MCIYSIIKPSFTADPFIRGCQAPVDNVLLKLRYSKETRLLSAKGDAYQEDVAHIQGTR